MPVSSSVLGMNARNFLYIRKYNPTSAKRIADDKLATKELLLRNNIATPALFAAFYTRQEIRNFHWELPETGFVIKPARGYGGGGIIAFKSWDGDKGVTVTGEQYSKKKLQEHLLDILDGGYSLQYLPDKAYIEERVRPDVFFKKIGAVGIPDIRIIVFHNVPVMAMMRFPTHESKGKANLQQGAIAIGIDMRTGITTTGFYKKKNTLITKLPETKLKIAGIKIPDWDNLLLLAAKTASVSRLGYAGVDIVVDAKHGPSILEINARPGLGIQIANVASLRTRLERVEGMKKPTPERGVEVAKSLFAEEFSEKVADIGPKILSVIEPVILKHATYQEGIEAKLDTGAYRSSLDEKLVERMGLSLRKEKVYVQSASGSKSRPTVQVTFELAGKKVTTIASVVNRSHLKYPMIVGRRDLRGFLINPLGKEFEEEEVVE